MASLLLLVTGIVFAVLVFVIGVPFNAFLYIYAVRHPQRVALKACASCTKKLAIVSGIGVGLGVPLQLLVHVSTSLNWLCTLHMSIAYSLHVFVSVTLVMFHFQRTLAVSPTKTIVYLQPNLKVVFYSVFAFCVTYFVASTVLFALSDDAKHCDVVRGEPAGDALYVMHCVNLAITSIPCTIAFEALALNTYLTLKAHVGRMATVTATQQGHREINIRKILLSLQVTAIYYVLWYPLTFLKLFQDYISSVTYYRLLSYFQVLTYTGFAIIPFVYASLDNRFLRYIVEKRAWVRSKISTSIHWDLPTEAGNETHRTRASSLQTKS